MLRTVLSNYKTDILVFFKTQRDIGEEDILPELFYELKFTSFSFFHVKHPYYLVNIY